jgi:hypothetical protein
MLASPIHLVLEESPPVQLHALMDQPIRNTDAKTDQLLRQQLPLKSNLKSTPMAQWKLASLYMLIS